jgi:hypothetical protein
VSPASGLGVDLNYPGTVSMPGTGFLSVDDPSDPATRVGLFDIDFYNGLVSFFDNDTTSTKVLQTTVSENGLVTPIPLNSPQLYLFARFDCTPGQMVSAAMFTCTVSDESDILNRTVPVAGRPACDVAARPGP